MKYGIPIILAILTLALAACGGGGGGGDDETSSPLAPGQPESVGATYSPPGQPGLMRVTWEVGQGLPPTGYIVYRKTIPEDSWVSIAEVDDTVFEVLDDGPFGIGPIYVYRVVAVNQAGVSPPGDTLPFAARPGTIGALYIWGRNDSGQAGVGDNLDDFMARTPAITSVVKASAGDGFTLALSTAGLTTQLLAFGDDSRGQLGDGPPMAGSNVPVLVTDPATGFGTVHFVTAMSAGGRHALAITDDGRGTRKLWAWGANSSGQVGDRTLTDRPAPVDLMPQLVGQTPINFIAVAAGDDFSLALTDDGRLYSWGSNSLGQLGQGLTASPPNVPGISASPLRVIFPGGLVGRVEMIVAGRAHALALERLGIGTARVWSFGDDREGQLGDAGGTLQSMDRPVLVSNSTGLGDVTQIDAGDSHSMTLDVNGNAWTWGALYTNPPGTNTTNPLPLRLIAPTNLVRIACGGRHSIVNRADGALYGWGDNQRGQLSFDPLSTSPGPILPTPWFLPGFAAIGARFALGGEHSIAFVP